MHPPFSLTLRGEPATSLTHHHSLMGGLTLEWTVLLRLESRKLSGDTNQLHNMVRPALGHYSLTHSLADDGSTLSAVFVIIPFALQTLGVPVTVSGESLRVWMSESGRVLM